MLRLILDTNVILDIFHFTDPTVRPILAALKEGEACCATDAACLGELERVVGYPQFGMSPETGAELVAGYRQLAALVDLGESPKLPRCKDRDDQKFLELAARWGADVLVSKDKALLKLNRKKALGFRVLKPAEAVMMLVERPAGASNASSID